MTAEPETWRRDGRWATVWPTGRRSVAAQHTAGGYPPVPPHAGGAVSPEVAAYAVAIYSQAGDTVCDPDCGPGTVVAEAVRARRHAVGISRDPDGWEAARAALTAVKAQGAPGDGMILDELPDRRSWTGLGPIDLVLTAIGPPDDPADPGGPAGARLRARLASYRDLPRPGGHLVVVAAYHVAGVDLASEVAAAGRDAGWRPVQRCVALTAVPYTRLLGTARPPARARAYPVHQDVIIFRRDGGRAREPRTPDPPPLAPAPHAALDSVTSDRSAA
ncbi:SAM-dependent methyltransferase [Frankia sp. Cr1]|uniref:SAM-dependent methyltransferase n=1 Tax=Frankia sp. Cr1 TaxID=3073931 RepID=UPI002AD4E738|nr:SAM-dependent methyltransferase [Frankia sp. Cr1]